MKDELRVRARNALVAFFSVWAVISALPESVIAADPLLTDSFEGTPPTGWDAGWNVVEFGNSTQDTTSVGGTPPGGGTYACRQQWENSSGRPGWIRYFFDSSDTEEGDIFEFEYYLKYHANFNTNGTYHKKIIMRGVNGALQEFIIDSFAPNRKMFAVFPLVNPDSLYSNINGGQYAITLGEWAHYRWQLKISTTEQGNKQNW